MMRLAGEHAFVEPREERLSENYDRAAYRDTSGESGRERSCRYAIVVRTVPIYAWLLAECDLKGDMDNDDLLVINPAIGMTARILFSLIFFLSGITHFTDLHTYMSLMPVAIMAPR